MINRAAGISIGTANLDVLGTTAHGCLAHRWQALQGRQVDQHKSAVPQPVSPLTCSVQPC